MELEVEQGLTCTFRSSCYSARLSWALVLTWVSPFVQDKKRLGLGWERSGYLATTVTLKEHHHPVKTVIMRVNIWAIELAMFL